jgi:hypothetical protein
MKTDLLFTILRGVVVGFLTGLLLGVYVCILSGSHVIRRSDYAFPILYEEAQSRYVSVILTSFSLVLAAVGPVVTAASFGPWIRHAVYGLVGGISLVLIVALVCAACLNQLPFNRSYLAYSTSIDLARMYFVPIAVVVGPICDIIVGRIQYPASNRNAPGA